MSSRVLVILTNWKRPQNMPVVIDAWREQSLAPAAVVVVDNSPAATVVHEYLGELEGPWMREGYPNVRFEGVDDVWRMKTNIGPLCRLWPALAMAPQYDYALFADDDFLPGREGLLAAVQAAKFVNDKFATIGQEGRTFLTPQENRQLNSPGWCYKFGNTPRLADGPQIVDCTVRCHLVLATHLPRVLRFREKLPAELCESHDDLTMCLGLQVDPGYPSYILPASSLERQLIKENLPGCNGPESCWKRPDHLTQRSQFINLAYGAGWRSFVGGS